MDSSVRETAEVWLERFGTALEADDVDAAVALFTEDGWLRDRLALTWDLRTFHGTDAIRRVLADRLASASVRAVTLDPRIEPRIVDAGPLGRWVQASFRFETAIGRGRGVVRLVQAADPARALAWTVLLDLRELKGHEEPQGARRPFGVAHGATRSAESWLDRRSRAQRFADGDPTVVVIGAGQSGLALAARLGQLDVATLVLERQPRVGDTWRNRYRSLVLHDPIWANHLPYMPFPETWPRFVAKDKLADWFEAYAQAMELNVWTSATVTRCEPPAADGRWTVTTERAGETRVMRPRHVVLATGHSGRPRVPDVAGAERFAGEILHASAYRGPEGTSGRRVVVVGAGNSAHDICHDLAEAGAEVTMIQRSRTYVQSSGSAFEVLRKGGYEQGGPPAEDVDHLVYSLPLPLFFRLHAEHLAPQIRARDAQTRDGLRRAGFQLVDDQSLIELYLRRGGGYYVDVGASAAIAEGRIKVRSGVELDAFTADGVALTDGTALQADRVVFATGYGSMVDVAREYLDDAIVDRLDPVWGLDDEGELRSVWRSSGQDGLWFAGGNLALVRHFSLTLALQVKAAETGLLDRYEPAADAQCSVSA